LDHTDYDEAGAVTHIFDYALVLNLADESVTSGREEAWGPIVGDFGRATERATRGTDDGSTPRFSRAVVETIVPRGNTCVAVHH
jgi:hypothetical protein